MRISDWSSDVCASELDAPRLILWPGAAVPDYLERGYPSAYYDRSPAEARARIVRLMNPGDVMLLGALKLELDKAGEGVGARNAGMKVHADGPSGTRFDKEQMVAYADNLTMSPTYCPLGLSRPRPGDREFC